MNRVIFFHLTTDDSEGEELTAVSIEEEGTESEDEARMYIWKCVGQCWCRFPDDCDTEPANERDTSFMDDREDAAKYDAKPDDPEPPSTLVSNRWRKERDRKMANKMLSLSLHQAKREKMMKVSSSTQTSPLEDPSMYTLCTPQNYPLTMQDAFIQECILNSRKARPTYSSLMYDMAMLLYLSSAKTYKILRQVLTLPAVSSLYRSYSQQLQQHRSRLTTISGIQQSFDEVKREMQRIKELFPEIEDFQFTLSIDAFSFQSFVGPLGSGAQITDESDSSDDESLLGENDDETKSVAVAESEVELRYGFVMMLIPHDYRITPRILHLALSPTGAYGRTIGCIADSIRQSCNTAGLRIWFKATDGDPGVSSEHEDFYRDHLAGQDACFVTLVGKIHAWLCGNPGSYVPIADPLHVLKNVRAKLLTHPIQLYADAPPSDIDGIRSVLNIGAALCDDSQIGKMRDCYVTQLFTFDNVATLLESEQYVHGFLLLPFACWTAVLFCTEITLNLRLFLVELAYQIIRHWTEQFPQLKSLGVAYRSSAARPIITFNDKHYAKRILNTLAAFGVCLGCGSSHLRLDSMGTHPVENSIGVARSGSHSDPRYERILSAYVHAEMKKEIAKKLGISLHVPGRLNDGGCKVHPEVELSHETGQLVSKPEAWRVDDIVHLVRAACSKDTGPAMKDDVKEFAHELRELLPSLDVRHYKVGSTANSCIMARLISFGGKGKWPQ